MEILIMKLINKALKREFSSNKLDVREKSLEEVNNESFIFHNLELIS